MSIGLLKKYEKKSAVDGAQGMVRLCGSGADILEGVAGNEVPA